MKKNLGDNDRRFALLVESIADHAIYMVDPEGLVQSWNPAAELIKGYRRDEILGRSFDRFFTAEDRAAGLPAKILERARAEGHVESEGWRVRKDGSRFWALATTHLIHDEAGREIGFAKITRDITEKRASEAALRESERRFKYLVEGVIDYAIFMLDVNGIVVNWNRGAERIKGYTAEDIVGRHFSLFYTPADRRSGLPAKALDHARREGRYEAEGWRVRKDGKRFWASVVIDAIHDDDGNHIGYAKITRDVTERRKADQALAQSEREFRLLVAGVVDYALLMLDPNGIVASWNSGAEHIKGYTADEIIGRHVSVFYTEADRAAGKPLKALQTAAEQGRYEAEAWRVRKGGELFWANVVIDAIRDDTGELIGFAKITRDITERRNAQLELQKAHDRLAQAQKMEAIGELTGGVAHDFNNLLMVVSGQSHMLRKRVGDDPRSVRALNAIEMATKRGQELTRHLLAFARRQRLHPVVVALDQRAAGISELLGTSIGSQIKLLVDFRPTLWRVEVDPGELELALLNMAVNARDAMPNGGVISVVGENVTLTRGQVEDLEGEFVAISIQDTGAGIPPDILPRVFDPFFSTKDVSKGTGLGLSQVYGFVQQSGGRVVVSSEMGRGTTFTLYLPRSRSEPTSVATESPAALLASSVLIVEDNPDVAEVAAELFSELGSRVQVVSSAQAALAALDTGDLPDLLFSDIVMAGDIDGLALARRIRRKHPELPILLATGYSQAAERIGTEFPILAKPYQLADLSRALASLVPGPHPSGGGNLVDLGSFRRDRRAEAG